MFENIRENFRRKYPNDPFNFRICLEYQFQDQKDYYVPVIVFLKIFLYRLPFNWKYAA